MLAMLSAGGGLLVLGYALRGIVVDAWLKPMSSGVANAGPGFGGATGMDMSMYMEMFSRHNEIRRTLEEIPGGVRTTTESDSPDLAALLHHHVPSMYSHLDQDGEIICMYHRQITLTPTGVVAVETADDPNLTQAIRAHAQEVSMRQQPEEGPAKGPTVPTRHGHLPAFGKACRAAVRSREPQSDVSAVGPSTTGEEQRRSGSRPAF